MAKALAKLQGLGHKVRRDEWQECRILQVDLPAPSSVDIEFKNITLTVSEGLRAKKKKTILKEISGRFKSGEVTAIMGPSGAGKSSLMNALTGFSTQGVTGTIRAGDSVCELGKNQKSLHNLKAYRKKSCYIMQDDRLNPLFTVAEAMKFAADMKLGNSLTDKIKITLINEVLGTLGLLGTEATRCGHLSGGQKKRLSIALELIDNPPVVFLDEPTTGLDSLNSMQCIQMLKSLARDGRTIVCSIHQPQASAYEMFDQVYILANGVTVYQGSSENTVPFLASIQLHCPKYHNPADFVMEVANGEYGDYNELLAEQCRGRDWTKEPQVPVASTGKQGFTLGKTTVAIRQPHEFYKFNVLLKRCLIQQYRDWTVCHLKIALHLFTGVMLGIFFWQSGGDGSKTFSNLGFLIISCVYLCYTTVMPAVLRFPLELNVLKKENFNNWYDLKTYYAAVLFTSIPIQIWYCLVYSTPSYFLSGQPAELSRFLMYVLVMAMLTLLADAMGNVIGAVANPVNGTFFGAIITCAMLVFSGFLALLSHMNAVMRTISYASFIKYSLEGLVLAVYSYGRQPLICPQEKLYCHLRYPKEILKEFSFKPDNYWIDILVLFAGMVTLRFIAYFTLKRFVKKSR